MYWFMPRRKLGWNVMRMIMRLVKINLRINRRHTQHKDLFQKEHIRGLDGRDICKSTESLVAKIYNDRCFFSSFCGLFAMYDQSIPSSFYIHTFWTSSWHYFLYSQFFILSSAFISLNLSYNGMYSLHFCIYLYI